MRLYVVREYSARGVHYSPGQVLEVDDVHGAFLFVDAPGCFSTKDPAEAPKPAQEVVVADKKQRAARSVQK